MTKKIRPLLMIPMLALGSMAALCSRSTQELQVTVQNKSGTTLSCDILLNQKTIMKTLDVNPGASVVTPISLTKLRDDLKALGQSTGSLHLDCKGLPEAVKLELFGYIEPADNYLSGKHILAEISDKQPGYVSIRE
jgi:hypothetical protein